MNSFNKTKSVKALLEVFYDSDEAISAINLVKLLKPIMNKTTVYRILDRLEKNKLLHKFIGKDGLSWYAKIENDSISDNSKLHPHFQCSDCGITKCLDQELSVPLVPNYKIDTAELLLIGQCENCLS